MKSGDNEAGVLMQRFSMKHWDATRRAVVDRAFREVPYYREQWALAGKALAEPVPVTSDGLLDQAFRLCPLSRPWLPGEEPSLWTGDPLALLEALRLAGASPRGVPVVEVRASMVDWTSLGNGGPRYGALLPPGADVVSEERRLLLNAPATALAADAGAVVLVGTTSELSSVRAELGASVDVTTVLRGPVGEIAAFGSRPGDPSRLAWDPCLGYLGATVPACGNLHALWRRHHVRTEDGALLVTALRRRPALCSVIPAGADGVTVGECAEHRSAILLIAGTTPV